MAMIKICGLFRDCDIDYVNEAQPDYAGFIIHFPKSHRSIEPERAAELRERLAPGIKAVGVFVDQPIDYVYSAAEMIGLDVIQLHGREDEDYIEVLRTATGLPVWKAFRVCRSLATKESSTEVDRSPAAKDSSAAAEQSGVDQDALEDAHRSPADLVLLDSGAGTGRTFDWSQIAAFDRPFILAGGLTPENIPEALQQFGQAGRLAAIDISSGVETDRLKDKEKILNAVRVAHAG